MRRSTKFLIIHCSATPPSHDIGRTEIDRWHRARGFIQIGYHYVIRRDGTLETGRPERDGGAHALNYNDKSVGICMVGGVEEQNVSAPQDNFSPAQWGTLLTLVEDLCARYPGVKVIGHNEVSNKACPSFDVQQWLVDAGLTSRTIPICPQCGQPNPD